jgi:hypothetical protein
MRDDRVPDDRIGKETLSNGCAAGKLEPIDARAKSQ